MQNDVSEKVDTEMQLTELMEVEHRLLEQVRALSGQPAVRALRATLALWMARVPLSMQGAVQPRSSLQRVARMLHRLHRKWLPWHTALVAIGRSVLVYPSLLASYLSGLQIFPRHVLEHIAMQNMAAAGKGGGSGGGGRQRRKSQFDLLQGQDCSQLAHHHDQISVLFCDVKGFTVRP